jgi:membrane protein DedA with SNARE-associated domain
VWIALLVLAGVLVGGVISFARNRAWFGAAILAAAAVLAFAGAYAWVPR